MPTQIEQQWKKEIEQYGLKEIDVDNIATSIYYANWKELPNERFPPRWENISDEVRNHVMNQATRAAISVECNVAMTVEILEELTHLALDR